jgi:hypothetical protein
MKVKILSNPDSKDLELNVNNILEIIEKKKLVVIDIKYQVAGLSEDCDSFASYSAMIMYK